MSRVYDQNLLINNNFLVMSGTNNDQFDGYFLLYLCTTATSDPPVSGSASLLILLLVGGSMSGGWYVSKQKKGSVAYRVIRVGVFALIVVVFLVGCNQGDPTGTPEPTPSPTECPPDVIPVPTVTPAPPTVTPVPVTDTPTPTDTPVSCVVAIATNQQKNGYAHPAPARTERFRGDPTSPSQTYVGLPPEQVAKVFSAGQYLDLATRYDRSGNEEHVYKVTAFSTDGGVNWQLITPVWISTNDHIQPVDTTGCISLPSENPVARYTFEATRENLRDYGIDIGPDTALWSEAELGVVLSGVQRITNAFAAFITDNFSATVSSPGLFRGIMIPSDQGVIHDYVIFRRASRNNCQFYDTGENGVNPFDQDAEPIHIECGPAASLWNGSLQPETVVHELGHLFDSRSGTDNRTNLSTYTEQAQIRDCDQTTLRYVMGVGAPKDGVPSTEWFRGLAGWGTMSEINVTSQFQQHPSDDPLVRAKEAAADMFLNWVYRYTTGGWISDADKCNPNVPATGQESWQGFRNLDSQGQINTTTLPGNVRFIWMQETLRTIFNQHPTWR